YSAELLTLASQGPESVVHFVKDKVWGIKLTSEGTSQLDKFCRFIQMHKKLIGVKEIAAVLGTHRSTIAEWREATDQPYLVKSALAIIAHQPPPGWKLLPHVIRSGANELSNWLEVPETAENYQDLIRLVEQMQVTEEAAARGMSFGLTSER